jgi:hypothetical protein
MALKAFAAYRNDTTFLTMDSMERLPPLAFASPYLPKNCKTPKSWSILTSAMTDSVNKHIRPRKREGAAKPSTDSTVGRTSSSAVAAVVTTTLPKSILKLPKYSNITNDARNEHESHDGKLLMDKGMIQERSKSSVPSSQSTDSSLAVDGYIPRISMTTTAASVSLGSPHTNPMSAAKVETKDDIDEPLVFSSLSQLLDAAGTLPPQNDLAPAVIEADVSFQCMDPDTYKDYQQMKEAEYYEACLGRPIILTRDCAASSGGDDHNGPETDNTDENTDPSLDDGDTNDLPWFGDDDDDDDEPCESRPPRLFAILWSAISQWVTPQAVDYIRNLRDHDNILYAESSSILPVYDITDIGVSRCAGLQALLKMHCKRCWHDELKQALTDQRTAERRLGELLRSLDYSLPTPKLTMAQTKALTCVLLDAVIQNEQVDGKLHDVPQCCETLGMTLDEYSYLTTSAFVNFGTPLDEE